MNSIKRPPFYVDILLVLGLVVLMVLSLMVLYSASGTATMESQAYRFLLGWLAFYGALLIPRDWLVFFSPLIYGVTIVLLLLVQFVGVEVNGSRRWLNVGIQIQPSELAKFAVPLMVAYLFRAKNLKPDFFALASASLLIALPGFLVLQQPDLGTALLVVGSGLVLLFFAGLSWRLMAVFAGVLVIALPLFWIYGIKDYQRDRVLTLFNPESDPFGKGYHIIQSKIAIGSGGLHGKGFTHGTQSQLEFLPEQTTDFIFAVYAEEFGFIGVLLLFTLYLFILWRLHRLTAKIKDNYARLLCAALTFTFFVYFFINAGMVMGIFPVVGLPLPLFSYGGTSILSIMLMLGIVNRLSREGAIQQISSQNRGVLMDVRHVATNRHISKKNTKIKKSY